MDDGPRRMTDEQARSFEHYWGGTRLRPENPAWRCCQQCGEWQPTEAPYWCGPTKRMCRACMLDRKRGIYPYARTWHKKNRWTSDGHLERRCWTCHQWRPLTAYYLYRKNDKARTRRDYPSPECVACTRWRSCARKARVMGRPIPDHPFVPTASIRHAY